MLERLLKHKVCIQKLYDNEDLPDMPVLEMAEWRLLKDIVGILSPLETSTKVWEHDTYPTIQTVGQELYNLQENLTITIKEKSKALRLAEQNPDTDGGVKFAKSLLESIKRRFPKYGLADDLAAWASLLDPRQKKLLLDEVGLTAKTKKSLEEYITRMHVEDQEEVQHDEVQPEEVPPKPETPLQKLKRQKYSETSDTMFEDETSAAERELAMY